MAECLWETLSSSSNPPALEEREEEERGKGGKVQERGRDWTRTGAMKEEEKVPERFSKANN